METHERQKKGFMFVYKAITGGGGRVPPETNAIQEVKKPVSRVWGLRKSKPLQEIENKRGVEIGRGEVIEARKSVSYIETNLSSAIALLQVKVLATDMPGFMQVHAFRCARRTYDSLEKFSAKHIAYNIKKEFDKVYGPAWHCIVGSSFGSFVTHATGCFLYFSMEKLFLLVFKTKVQKALH